MNNILCLIGRITKDIEIRKNANDTSVAIITIAVSRSFKNSEGVYDTDFFNVTAWGYIAENVSEYCKKGDLIAVKGRLQNANYEKDGKKYYRNEIIAEKISFLATNKNDKKDKNGNSDKVSPKEETKEVDPFKEFSNEVELTDDDLPF